MSSKVAPSDEGAKLMSGPLPEASTPDRPDPHDRRRSLSSTGNYQLLRRSSAAGVDVLEKIISAVGDDSAHWSPAERRQFDATSSFLRHCSKLIAKSNHHLSPASASRHFHTEYLVPRVRPDILSRLMRSSTFSDPSHTGAADADAAELGSHSTVLRSRSIFHASTEEVLDMHLNPTTWHHQKIVEHKAPNHFVLSMVVPLPPPYLPRRFLSDSVWFKLPVGWQQSETYALLKTLEPELWAADPSAMQRPTSSVAPESAEISHLATDSSTMSSKQQRDSFLLTYIPTSHPSVSFGPGASEVLSSGKKVLLIQPSAHDPSFTVATQITEISLEAFLVPSKVLRSAFVSHQMRYLSELRRRFVNTRPLATLSDADAKDLGEEIVKAVVVTGGGFVSGPWGDRESEKNRVSSSGVSTGRVRGERSMKERSGRERSVKDRFPRPGKEWQRPSLESPKSYPSNIKEESKEESAGELVDNAPPPSSNSNAAASDLLQPKLGDSALSPVIRHMPSSGNPPSRSTVSSLIKDLLSRQRHSGGSPSLSLPDSFRKSNPQSLIRLLTERTMTVKDSHRAHDASALLADFVDGNDALGEFASQHSWLEYLISAILTNRLVSPKLVDLKLEELDEEDNREIGTVIGAALPFFLASLKDVPLAVSQWVEQYPAMVEVSEKYPWFKTLVATLVMQLDNLKNGSRMVDIALFERQDFGLMHAAGDPTFMTIQANLGNERGTTFMFLIIFLSYLVNVAIFSVPLSSPFAGARRNFFVIFCYTPLVLWWGCLVIFGFGSVCSHMFLAAQQMTFGEELRVKFRVINASYLWTAIPCCIIYWNLSFLWVYPVPWTIYLVFAVCSMSVMYIFRSVRRRYPDIAVSKSERNKTLFLFLCVILPFAIYLPVSVGAYLSLRNYEQFFLVLFTCGFRMGISYLLEILGRYWKINEVSILTSTMLIDMLYDVQAATQFARAQFVITLITPPLLGFLSNVVSLVYILYFLKGDLKRQTIQLIAMGMRELIEITTSCGVQLILSCMWYFQKNNFYMIDTIELEHLKKAWILSIVDLVNEVVVFYIFDRVVYKVWRVSLLNLSQAFVKTIGYVEFFGILSGSTTYILLFLSYHMGSDYFFRFEWILPENRGDDGWCISMQRNETDPTSCYIY